MYKLYDRLRELRERENISQSRLASEIGTTRASVNAWEMGISTPNAQSLIAISKYFKTTVDYLLGIDDGEYIDISSLKPIEKELICSQVRYFNSLK